MICDALLAYPQLIADSLNWSRIGDVCDGTVQLYIRAFNKSVPIPVFPEDPKDKEILNLNKRVVQLEGEISTKDAEIRKLEDECRKNKAIIDKQSDNIVSLCFEYTANTDKRILKSYEICKDGED